MPTLSTKQTQLLDSLLIDAVEWAYLKEGVQLEESHLSEEEGVTMDSLGECPDRLLDKLEEMGFVEVVEVSKKVGRKVNAYKIQKTGVYIQYRLTQKSLEWAKERGLNLVGIQYRLPINDREFYGEDFRNQVFRYTNFSFTRLKGANFRRVDLARINFKGADLRLADLRGANLANANLEGVIWQGTKYDGKTIWPKGFEINQGLMRI